ncbi:unnamed protein product, partial [Prorocentrum cordatum]
MHHLPRLPQRSEGMEDGGAGKAGGRVGGGGEGHLHPPPPPVARRPPPRRPGPPDAGVPPDSCAALPSPKMAAEPPRSCLRKRGQPRRPSAPDRAVVTGRVFVAPTPGAPEAGEAAGEAGPPPPCRADAGGGWQASWQASASALLKYDVKAFARGVLDDANEVAGRVRPWAVRGEAYQDQSQHPRPGPEHEVPRTGGIPDQLSVYPNCSCVALVQCGVRMRLPMKIFAHNFVELVHGSTRVAVCADAAGALRRWAVLSLDMVNDRRAGRPAWSGWSSYDRSGADLPESIVQREEWDWTYRTDYAPSAGVAR